MAIIAIYFYAQSKYTTYILQDLNTQTYKTISLLQPLTFYVIVKHK